MDLKLHKHLIPVTDSGRFLFNDAAATNSTLAGVLYSRYHQHLTLDMAGRICIQAGK